MPNLQKKRLLSFEIFNIKKCTFLFGTESINQSIHASVCPTHTIHPLIQCPFLRPSNHLPGRPLIHPSITYPFLRLQAFSSIQPTSQPASESTNQLTKTITGPVKTRYLIAYQVPNIRFIYSLNVKFRSVMSTVQRVAIKIISKETNYPKNAEIQSYKSHNLHVTSDL